MDKMNVCYATSNEFTIHTGISLLSLLDNNRDVIGTAYILDYGMTDESKQKLKDICDKYDVEIKFIWAKDTLIEIGEQTGIKNFRDSFATYSRAFLDKLLPEDVDKVLYIDSDTVVIGSVADVMNIDMTDKVICGCAVCSFFGRRKDGADRCPELDSLLTKNKFYIQCGILWYSLNNWREKNCSEMILKATKLIDNYRFADQTLINNALPDKLFTKLHIKYNLTQHNNCEKYNLLTYRCGGFYSDSEILEAIHSPIIIHYCGGAYSRPWYNVCISRRKEHYLHYKSISAWKDVPIQVVPKPDTFKKKIREKMVAWGMKTNSYVMLRVISKIRRVFFE